MNVDELARAATSDLVRTSTADLDSHAMLKRMRRTGTVRTSLRTAVAVGAVALVLVVGAVTWSHRPTVEPLPPAGTHGTQPTSSLPPLTQTFTSPMYQYSISYPAGWVAYPATRAWTYGRPAAHEGHIKDPAVYDFLRVQGGAFWSISAQEIPAGMTAEQWEQLAAPDPSTLPSMGFCFPAWSQMEQVTVDQHPARVRGGIRSCDFTDVIVVVGRRGYVFTASLGDNPGASDVYDRGLLDRVLATVRFQGG